MSMELQITVAEENAASLLTSGEKIKDEFLKYITNPALWTDFVLITIKIIFIFVAARVVIKLANKALEHMMLEREKNPLKLDRRRTKTIGKLMGNIMSYVVNFIMVLMI